MPQNSDISYYTYAHYNQLLRKYFTCSACLEDLADYNHILANIRQLVYLDHFIGAYLIIEKQFHGETLYDKPFP